MLATKPDTHQSTAGEDATGDTHEQDGAELRTNPGVGRIPICNNVGVKQRHCQNHNCGKNEFHFHLHKPPCIYDMWASIPVFTSLLSLFH